MTTEWLILARAIHFSACLLLFGVLAFDRFVAVSVVAEGPSESMRDWDICRRRVSAIALPTALLSGVIWFVLVAVTMSGLSLDQALQPEVLKTVWSQTLFGTVSQFRLVVWTILVVLVVLHYRFQSQHLLGSALIWGEMLFSGCLLGSLAWAGHGQEGPRAGLHLTADVVHLLVAGVWPAGLLPFILLLRKLRLVVSPARWQLMSALVRRFSAFSLVSAALLTLTGFINSWFLVGSIPNLFQQTYGRFLLLKILLFGVAIGIGVVNILRLKPRIAADVSQGINAEASILQLQRNVQLELLLGMVIVVVVAILGVLPPAIP